ncbi:MAG: calcium-binding protein [Candidatus Dadabacteria bacterium]|nr:calcium-binding protein [Candidatus Dadabacteria bacterium]
MRLRNLFMILLLCMTVGLFAVSCSDGDTGPQGPPGETGPPGPAGTPAPTPDPEDDGDDDDMSEADCISHKFGPNDVEKFTGGDGDEVICGNKRSNVIEGMGGDDTISGAGGNDTLEGGPGDDELHGGEGDDTLKGEAGDDTLKGEAGKDTLYGGDGKDTLYGGEGDDMIKEEDTDTDVIDGGVGTDTLDYSALTLANLRDAVTPAIATDDDVYLHVSLTEGESAIWENEGSPEEPDFSARKILDIIEKEIENVIGSTARNHLVGDDKDNVLTITGTILNGNKIKGMGGHDTIDAGWTTDTPGANDLVDGGAGNDTLVVGAGGFTLPAAPAGADASSGIRGIENLAVRADVTGGVTLTGDAQANTLTGGGGEDTINGGAGNDTINGGKGEDTTLNGQAGNDIYVIGYQEGRDTITLNYNVNEKDMVHLKGFPKDQRSHSKIDEVADAAAQIAVNGAPVLTLATGDGNASRTDVLTHKASIFKFVD